MVVSRRRKKNNRILKLRESIFTSFELKDSFIASLSVPVKTIGQELYRRLRHKVKCSIPMISSVQPSATRNDKKN
jgi:hypothetical protein